MSVSSPEKTKVYKKKRSSKQDLFPEAKLERVSKKLKLDFASDTEDTDIDDFEPLPPLNLEKINIKGKPSKKEKSEEEKRLHQEEKLKKEKEFKLEENELKIKLEKYRGTGVGSLSEEEWLNMTELGDRLDEIYRIRYIEAEFGDGFLEQEVEEEGELAFLGCCDREFNRSDISDDEAVREYSVVVSEEIWEDDDDDARLTEDVSLDNVAEPEVEENRTVAPAPVYDNLPVSFKLDKVLEDLSDSEDEDSAVIEKSENLDQNETMIESNELSPVSSPLSLQDKNGNTTKKDEIDMSMWDPYENSSIGYFLVAHYIACSRWAKINGLDLNFTGFVMSVETCCLFGRDMLKENPLLDPEHSSCILNPGRIRNHKKALAHPNAGLEMDLEGRKMITAPVCVNFWTFLTADDGLKDVPLEFGDGWIELVDVFMQTINPETYAPPSVIHRIMIEGLRDYPEPFVRYIVYSALDHTYKCFSPGPSDLFGSNYYLEMMNPAKPGKMKPGIQDENTPWTFLNELTELCVSFIPDSSKSYTRKISDEVDEEIIPDPIWDTPGPFLLLEFWTCILDRDLKDWFDLYCRQEQIYFRGVERPLIARVFFFTGEVRWNRRCESFCKLYVAGLGRPAEVYARTCIRKLVGLLAQTLCLAEKMKIERFSPESELNLYKNQMARCIANNLFAENISDNELMRKELFLLEPSWLSSAVSTIYLGRLTGAHFNLFPTLTDVMNNFVTVGIQDKDNNEEDEEEMSSPGAEPNIRITPTKENIEPNSPNVKARSKSALKPRNTPTKSSQTPSKPSQKINLNYKNQYGERHIHLACKKNDIQKLHLVLNTPGVDVNVPDNGGNTALHEAVNSNSIEAVKLLLNFVPHVTLDKFFSITPKKGSLSVGKKNNYADLLALDQHKESPMIYAVHLDRVEILKYILEFLQEQEKKKSSKFPKLSKVFEISSESTSSLLSKATSEPMKDLLDQYYNIVKSSGVSIMKIHPTEPIPLTLVKSERFQMLLKNSLHRYFGAQNMYLCYRLWKTGYKYEEFKPERIQQLLAEEKEVVVHEDLKRFEPIDYKDSSVRFPFGNPPRFDVFRPHLTKADDLKVLENLKYHEEKLANLVDPRNPILSFRDMHL